MRTNFLRRQGHFIWLPLAYWMVDLVGQNQLYALFQYVTSECCCPYRYRWCTWNCNWQAQGQLSRSLYPSLPLSRIQVAACAENCPPQRILYPMVWLIRVYLHFLQRGRTTLARCECCLQYKASAGSFYFSGYSFFVSSLCHVLPLQSAVPMLRSLLIIFLSRTRSPLSCPSLNFLCSGLSLYLHPPDI